PAHAARRGLRLGDRLLLDHWRHRRRYQVVLELRVRHGWHLSDAVARREHAGRFDSEIEWPGQLPVITCRFVVSAVPERRFDACLSVDAARREKWFRYDDEGRRLFIQPYDLRRGALRRHSGGRNLDDRSDDNRIA